MKKSNPQKEPTPLEELECPGEPEFRERPYFQGLNAYAEGTFDCSEGICWYNQYGRCIYNIAPIRFPSCRSCHDPFDVYDPD